MSTSKSMPVVPLAAMLNGQEADLFALLVAKEELQTRDGKPYFKVSFRDDRREVSFPIWADSPHSEDCRARWTPGLSYKLRAIYRETTYGPQLEIRKIRETNRQDTLDGFDPAQLRPHSRFDVQSMWTELTSIARDEIPDPALSALVLAILEEHRQSLVALPAATRHHHAFAGGFLEHVLSVTRTCVFLARKYDDYYPDLTPRLNRGLVVAGGILHDIGKLRELSWEPTGAEYTPAGSLIGHILQGRDIVREAAARQAMTGPALDPDTLLRLEHVIVSHQRLPEWGSPKPPMTPEAFLVHYADDLDAKFFMFHEILAQDTNPGPTTSKKNLFGHALYRGQP